MTTDNLREGGHKGPSFSRRTFAKAAGVSAAALAIGASGASLAWFTGRDVKENKLSIAQNLNIRVVEPAWDPENAKSVVPNQHIPKDPRIENLSDEFSGWMVVEIRVPTAVVSIFDEGEQKVLDPARTPLFSFVADPQWTLLQQFEDGDEDVYRFGWPETIPALGQTPPIFEEVVVANLAEAQGQSGSKTITATGYGIQSEGLPDIETAWDAYKKQNGIGDGEPDKRIVSAVTAGTLLKFVEGVPEVGDDIDGNTIEEVVPNIEHLPAQDTTPLTSTPEIITYVDGTTPTAPESTVNWFKDMSEVEKIDISGMNTDGTVDMTGMFSGDTKLQSIKIGESTDIATVVPKDFVLDAYVYSNPWKNPEKLIVTPTTANHDSMNFSIQNLTGQSVYGEIVIREICVQYTNKKDEIYSNDSQTMYVPSWGVGNMFGKSGAFTFLAGSCENNGKLLSNLFDSKYFKKAILKCNISGTNKNFEVALEAFAVNQVEKDACAGALCTKDESGNIAIRADSYTVNTIAPSITVNGKTYNDILGKWDLSSMRIAADNTQCTFSFGSDEATALLKDLIASSDASSRLTESASWRYFLLPDAVAQAIGKNNPNSGDICGLSVKWSPLRFQSGKLGIIDASQHVVNCIWE